MITALLSASRGIAVFDDGERTGALLEETGEPVWLGEAELARLLRGADDVETLTAAGMPQLRALLGERETREQALHAALLLIDGESSLTLRRTAARTWMQALGLGRATRPRSAWLPGDWQVASVAREGTGVASPWPGASPIERWVEGVLMSVPAPPQADFEGALALLPASAGGVFLRVAQHQPRIRSVHAAFLATCRRLEVDRRSPLRTRAVQEGWFRSMVLAGPAAVTWTGAGHSPQGQEFLATWTELLEAPMGQGAPSVL